MLDPRIVSPESVGSLEDFYRLNRGGGWYHGLSEMLQYGFLGPELVNGILVSYYNLLPALKTWSESGEENHKFIPFA